MNMSSVVVEIALGHTAKAVTDPTRNGDIEERLVWLGRDLKKDLGIDLQPVRFTTALGLTPEEYEIRLEGHVGRGMVFPDRLLALESGEVSERIAGRSVKEPAYGHDAVWIDPAGRETAEARGYVVVNAAAVVAVHVGEIIRQWVRDSES